MDPTQKIKPLVHVNYAYSSKKITTSVRALAKNCLSYSIITTTIKIIINITKVFIKQSHTEAYHRSTVWREVQPKSSLSQKQTNLKKVIHCFVIKSMALFFCRVSGESGGGGGVTLTACFFLGLRWISKTL